MFRIIKSPEIISIDNKSIFLAGTIDNGNSTDWQSKVQERLKTFDTTIFNPRREAWDSTWKQSIENPNFKEQVEWELEHLEKADCILMNFVPGSKSPITLLELGLFAKNGNVIISCPEGFWRKGNIEVIANKYSIPLFQNLEEAVSRVIIDLNL